MNNGVASMCVYHVSNGGKTLTVLAGEGFVGLTSRTACTYLTDSDHTVTGVVLESDAAESVDEVIDFFEQSVFLARFPESSQNDAMRHLKPCIGNVRVYLFLGSFADQTAQHIRSSFTRNFGSVSEYEQ